MRFFLTAFVMYAFVWGSYAMAAPHMDKYIGEWVPSGYVLEWFIFFSLQGAFLLLFWRYKKHFLGVMILRLGSALGYLGLRLGFSLANDPYVVGYILCFALLYSIFMIFELMILLYNLRTSATKGIETEAAKGYE